MKQHLILAVLLTLSLNSEAQTGQLPRVSPEQEGIPSRAVNQLFDSLLALPRTDIHSVVVMRHGRVVGELYPEPFKAEFKHTMYSCSKTFVSAAIGIAIGQHRLSLTDRVVTFFPGELPDTLSENLGKMTIRDLLVMSSGITPDWEMRNHSRQWVKTFLSKPVKVPGQGFEYDSMATYMLSAILQKATGRTLFGFLQEHVFQPLGIEEVEWETSPEGINTGGWGLYIQSESLAKFGQLLLQRGQWNGLQVIPEAWVGEMMKVQQPNGGMGYGYQMWPCEYADAFRADGALGQYILVVPKQEMVVVITENTAIDGIRQRRLVWNVLMPQVSAGAIRRGKSTKSIVRRDVLAPVKGKKVIPQQFPIGETLSLAPNRYDWKSIKFTKHGNLALTLTMVDGTPVDIPLGYGKWLSTSTQAAPAYSILAQDRFHGVSGPFHIAGSYATGNDHLLHVQLLYTNWVTSLEVMVDLPARRLLVYENHSTSPYEIKMP